MLSPANKTFVLSGGKVYAGQAAPSTTPAWMTTAGAALNKLVAIPNSAATGTPMANSGIFAFSGLTSKPDTCELFSVLAGGHGDSNDNGVYSFGPKGQGLLADAPTWIQRCAPTPSGNRVPNVAIQTYDNKPSSRHSYDRHHYVPQVGRIVILGGTGVAGASAVDDFNIHAYDVNSDTWDAPGTFTFNTGFGGNFASCVDPNTGLLWSNGQRSYSAATKTYGANSGPGTVATRFPMVVDTLRNRIFCLQWGDGWSTSSPLNASVLTLGTTPTQSAITFNASAAYTQFVSDGVNGLIPGMTYDSINDVFYWYNGLAGQENHLYVIHPNNTTVWDMTMFSFASGSATMPTVASSGFCGRIKYYPLLKGVVLYPTGDSLTFTSQSMYFLKTST